MNVGCTQQEQIAILGCLGSSLPESSPPEGALQYHKTGKHAGTSKMLFDETNNALTLNILDASLSVPATGADTVHIAANAVRLTSQTSVQILKQNATTMGGDLTSNGGFGFKTSSNGSSQVISLGESANKPVLRATVQMATHDHELKFFVDGATPAGITRSTVPTIPLLSTSTPMSALDLQIEVNKVLGLLHNLGLAKAQ